MIDPETIAEKVRATLAIDQKSGQNVPSPCVSVCNISAQDGLCEGCLRTLDEIARWSALDEAARRRVWALIGRRAGQKQGIRP